AIGADDKSGDQVPRWLADKGGAVPVFLWVVAGGVECMPRRRGEAAVMVYLADFFGNRLEMVIVGDAVEDRSRPAPYALVVAVGNRHELARVAVRRGAKDEPFLADPQ